MNGFRTVSEGGEWGQPRLRLWVLQGRNWGVNGRDVFHDRGHIAGESPSQSYCFYSHWSLVVESSNQFRCVNILFGFPGIICC